MEQQYKIVEQIRVSTHTLLCLLAKYARSDIDSHQHSQACNEALVRVLRESTKSNYEKMAIDTLQVILECKEDTIPPQLWTDMINALHIVKLWFKGLNVSKKDVKKLHILDTLTAVSNLAVSAFYTAQSTKEKLCARCEESVEASDDESISDETLHNIHESLEKYYSKQDSPKAADPMETLAQNGVKPAPMTYDEYKERRKARRAIASEYTASSNTDREDKALPGESSYGSKAQPYVYDSKLFVVVDTVKNIFQVHKLDVDGKRVMIMSGPWGGHKGKVVGIGNATIYVCVDGGHTQSISFDRRVGIYKDDITQATTSGVDSAPSSNADSEISARPVSQRSNTHGFTARSIYEVELEKESKYQTSLLPIADTSLKQVSPFSIIGTIADIRTLYRGSIAGRRVIILNGEYIGYKATIGIANPDVDYHVHIDRINANIIPKINTKLGVIRLTTNHGVATFLETKQQDHPTYGSLFDIAKVGVHVVINPTTNDTLCATISKIYENGAVELDTSLFVPPGNEKRITVPGKTMAIILE